MIIEQAASNCSNIGLDRTVSYPLPRTGCRIASRKYAVTAGAIAVPAFLAPCAASKITPVALMC
jgi:hypothetical protein